MAFPPDDYTPHGMLANPTAFARSWADGEGGTIQTCDEHFGIGWRFPWATRPTSGLDLRLALAVDGEWLRTWDEFLAAGLRTPCHSSTRLGYTLSWRGFDFAIAFNLVEEQELRAELTLRDTAGAHDELILRQHVVRWTARDAHRETVEDEAADLHLIGLDRTEVGASMRRVFSLRQDWRPVSSPPVQESANVPQAAASEARTDAHEPSNAWVAFHIGLLDSPPEDTGDAGRHLADDRFWATAPRLEGDWPDHWRRGLVYDLETTRMCVQPPGGVFQDVWPAWMVNWPRAVLAEGTLDMLRLSYADPDTAKRAVLSLLRDTPGDQVPCVFRGGEPNMVARDGSVCGTSPAWCVPLYGLKLLYLHTLDRDWLAAIYPHLAAYVEWWAANRSDAAGWTVYRCTWESGEDDNLRLDSDGTGDGIISNFVRPVELQASMAHAAATLALFARALGREADLPRWQALEAAARERLERLWDERSGRYRDWDVRRDHFLEASGRADYLGTDPRRYSALSLTPILFDQVPQERLPRLCEELERYDCAPWSEWPSWSYVVLEAASRAGWRPFASRMAAGIVERVYRLNDRRDLGVSRLPLPGVASEFWTLDLGIWSASDGYGWGATTAQYVIRQLFGFFESSSTSGVRFTLAPALPADLLGAGRELCLGPLPYRGDLLRLAYAALGDGRLEVRVEAERGGVVVRDERGAEREVRRSGDGALFALANFERVEIELAVT